jgi:hypothetical protein
MSKKKTTGQSLVEFALVLPILLVILVIVADLSRAIAAQVALANAAREGARYAVLHPLDINGIRNRALLEYNNSGVHVTGMELEAGNIIVSYPRGPSTSGNTVRVAAESDFPLFFDGFFPPGALGLGDTMRLRGTAEMVIF